MPPNTLQPLQVISGTGFCGSDDPTNSVKALKEDRVIRIRLQSHQVHLAILQLYNNAVDKKTQNTHKPNESISDGTI